MARIAEADRQSNRIDYHTDETDSIAGILSGGGIRYIHVVHRFLFTRPGSTSSAPTC